MDGGPCALHESRVVGRDYFTHAAIAGDEALREADDAGTPGRGLCNGMGGERDRFIGRSRVREVGERDAK